MKQSSKSRERDGPETADQAAMHAWGAGVAGRENGGVFPSSPTQLRRAGMEEAKLNLKTQGGVGGRDERREGQRR